MTLQSKSCDDRLLTRFLHRELSDDEQSALAEHLDACPRCCRELESRTAQAGWWQAAGESLRDEPYELKPLSEWLSTGGDEDADDGRHAEIERVLERLAPTDDPQSLGRIGGYEVRGVIGQGGMGVVLKAFDPALNRFVAIKTLAPHLAVSGAARKRFAREAQAAAAVVQDNVIEIYAVHEQNALPYLVMPYMRGTTLQKRLDQGGPLSLVEILRIARQTALGLAAAHAQGLVHRDVKPANILLAEGVERVKITDFGLARAADDASLTRTGVIVGTPQYMSPEQARGEAVDHQSDLFSLGSVMYAMCTGRPPFRAESSLGVLRRITDTEPRDIRENNPQVPDWLCRIIGRLHAKAPKDRFSSADEVARLLEQCLAHVQTPFAPLPLALCPPRSPWFQNRIVLASIASAVLLVSLGGIAWWNSHPGSAPEKEGQQPTQIPPVENPDPSLAGDPPSRPATEHPAAEWNAASMQLESLSRDFAAFEERAGRLWDQTPLEEAETENATIPLKQEQMP